MDGLEQRLTAIEAHFGDIEEQLAAPDVYQDLSLVQQLGREQARLREVVEVGRSWRVAAREAAEAAELMRTESDPDVVALAEAEEATQREQEIALRERLRLLLLPRDPHDGRNVVVEIRAGTGGEEAALFGADLFRMYNRYAERYRWQVELLSSSESGAGHGLREVIFEVKGPEAYTRLRFESGVHRVQRVPDTETQGRVHTSAASVVVLPEADEVEVEIDERDLKVDVFRSTGPGGQSVNTTDSAVRITHLPSGLVVTCQDEKSQHKNKAKALRVLRARLLDRAQAEHHAELSATRKSAVGSGDRSEKVRTYNFPQSRVTDHRIGLDVYQLAKVMDGELDVLVDPLLQEDQARRLVGDMPGLGTGQVPGTT